MGRTPRREFLKLGAIAASASLLRSVGAEAATLRSPDKLDRYVDPLPIPKRMVPVSTKSGKDVYRVRMMEFEGKLHSQLPPTRMWGYEGQYPGPVIEAFRGRPVQVQWLNQLPRKHLLPVDKNIHGAMDPTPEVRTVPHLHGSATDSISDGLPEDWFTPGHSATFDYPNRQRAAALWYHDHAMGITRLNMYAGMAGFYLLRDAEEKRMGLPAGENEIPLILQDRTLDAQGQLVYAPTGDDSVALPRGTWGPMFFGELPVVNGAIFPYVDVRPEMYRLRLLNASNSRFVNLYLNLAKNATDIPRLMTMRQIGSDGGLLPRPVAMEKILLGPGERADLVVDFSELAGKTLLLNNDASAPYPGWTVMGGSWPQLPEWMQFRVQLPKGPKRSYSLPSDVLVEKLDVAAAVRTREFVLSEELDANGKSLGLHINGKGYDDPVTEEVTLGTTEVWRFVNTSDDAHTMHLHLVQFQVVGRQGFDLATFRTSGKVSAKGVAQAPHPGESGWKDTAAVNPGEVLTIVTRFEGFTGRYVFHCHMLEHEDNDMMRPFLVLAPKASPAPARGR